MGRLIKNRCTGFPLQPFQNHFPLFFIHWQKTFKAKASGRKPRHRQRRDTGSRAGQGRHLDSRFKTKSYQFFSRVGNARRSCIRHQRDIFPRFQIFHKNFSFIDFIKFVIAGHRCFYIKMIQQFYRMTGVFRRDHIHTAQSFQYPESDIFQIAYRCGT